MAERPVTILCIASFFKGSDFMREAKRQGAYVLLLTHEHLIDEDWPYESIDERFLMPDLTRVHEVMNAVSYLFRGRQIDQIIPLDEYDVATVAALREHLRIPGMTESATRYFRDKLAMRMRAQANGIRVPDFTPVFNYDVLRDFMGRVPAQWVLKPRTEAGTIGIKKIHDSEQLWRTFDELGDRQSNYLLERFVPGDVYHADTIMADGDIKFVSVQKYGIPPMSVSHEGGIFTTRILPRDSADTKAIEAFNAETLSTLGMEHGVTHMEFIKGHADGQFYFLEVAARVGGANIADLIEAATGINLWAQWASVEIARLCRQPYKLPPVRNDYAGLLNSLARQEYPDTSAYTDSEITWRAHKRYHVGMIVASPDYNRVEQLLNDYSQRFANDFMAVAPPPDKAVH